MYWCFIPSTPNFNMTPKRRYKLEQSWKRWEKRYGEPKKLLAGEIGVYEGVRIIRMEKL